MSGLFSSVISYPFDLIYARAASNSTNTKVNSAKSFLNYKKYSLGFKLFAYYEFYSISIIESTLNAFIVLAIYNIALEHIKIKSNQDNIKLNNKNIFYSSNIIGLVSSLITYPINTYKRLLQVEVFCEEPKFNNKKKALKTLVKKPLIFYR